MKPFFSFLFFSLSLSFGAIAQEANENIPLNNKIIQNQQSDNNDPEIINDHLLQGLDSIQSYQDIPIKAIEDKKGRADSLSNSLKDKLTGWQDSTSLNSDLNLDTLRYLPHTVLDTLNSVSNKVNSTLLNDQLTKKIFPKNITNSSIHDKIAVDSPIPNGQLSPLQNELGLEKITLPNIDHSLNKLNALKGLPEKTLSPEMPEGVPDPSEVNTQNIDQIVDNQAGKLDAVQELQQQSGEAFGNADELKSIGNDVQQYGDIDQMKQMGSSAVNEETVKKMNELFDKHSDQLDQAKSLMSKLKKKYSYVPNSNDLSTARKASSLEDKPLKKRLTVGGNFKFERGNPLTLDLSPYIMYKINKEFYTGVSASYRFRINYDPKANTTHAEDVVGGSLIVRHKVYKGFFGYSEFEYRSAPVSYDSTFTSETIYHREWMPGLLLGIGKEMTLKGKLKGTVILTYDFLHSDKSFNHSPWNVKFGFNLDDLDLKNRKKELKENFLNSIGR